MRPACVRPSAHRGSTGPDPAPPNPGEIGAVPIGSGVPDEVIGGPRGAAAEPGRDDVQRTGTADAVRLYLRRIGKVALLDAAREVVLAKRIEAGLLAGERLAAMTEPTQTHPATPELPDASREDLARIVADGQRAKTHLLEANLRLVVSIARRHTGRGLDLLDLIQEGNLGLMRAVEKFDYAKGFKFSTYATWWIRQAINRALAEQARTIRIPVHQSEVINQLGRTQRELYAALGREPTVDELAAEMDLSAATVVQLRLRARVPVSLDQPIDDEGHSTLGDFVEDADTPATDELVVSTTLLREHLHAILATLPEREAAVLRLRYGLTDGQPLTLRQIGEVYGLTRERIRQIENKAMTRLRHPTVSDALRDYLE
jgi:RNA polymerase primary sigma factor